MLYFICTVESIGSAFTLPSTTPLGFLTASSFTSKGSDSCTVLVPTVTAFFDNLLGSST